jgi:hypothetical protein
MRQSRFPIRARSREGRCYELSYKIHWRAEEIGRDLLMVHGTDRGRNGRIDHAWLLDEEGGMVYDSTFDRWYPVDFYLSYFPIIEERRYTRKEAVMAMLDTGHSCPWHRAPDR